MLGTRVAWLGGNTYAHLLPKQLTRIQRCVKRPKLFPVCKFCSSMFHKLFCPRPACRTQIDLFGVVPVFSEASNVVYIVCSARIYHILDGALSKMLWLELIAAWLHNCLDTSLPVNISALTNHCMDGSLPVYIIATKHRLSLLSPMHLLSTKYKIIY
jgi:hypothetical protein